MRRMRRLVAVPALLLAVTLTGCEVGSDVPAPPSRSPTAASRPSTSPSPADVSSTSAPSAPADRTPEVLARIPVGGVPSDLAIAPEAGLMYVSNRGGWVTIIDIVARRRVAAIPVGSQVFGLAVDEAAGLLYAADADTPSDGRVVVVDLASRQVVDTIPVGERAWPVDVALDRDRGLLFVAASGNDTLLAVDTIGRQVVRRHSVGAIPAGVTVDARTGIAYVTGSSVTAVDTATLLVLGTAEAGGGRIAVDESAGIVLVAEEGEGTVALVDGRTLQVIDRAEVGGRGPFAAVPDPSRGLVWVTGGEGGELTILETATLETVARLDPLEATGPWFGIAAVDPLNDVVYVTAGPDVLVLERI
ncbi:hypothetical protein [Naasia sp. SYSU D00057]|uniref:hypothetical protein n=1 Tax=Naasia sp. SYSU D00057 TaxID=2817380 RepID=UPI001B30CDE7|nr:hypothetical protein [Naasia sp. SYSU D00057]